MRLYKVIGIGEFYTSIEYIEQYVNPIKVVLAIRGDFKIVLYGHNKMCCNMLCCVQWFRNRRVHNDRKGRGQMIVSNILTWNHFWQKHLRCEGQD